ncbi:MAG: hypothetical protein JXA90_09230 [Planctomycetes bacterium]|nr:hypothetical protein [Planctomycetota bacterium]
MRRNVRRGILLALVVCLLATLVTPPPSTEAAMTMIPVMDMMNSVNMVLAFAQRLMSYVTQVLQYYNRIEKYELMVKEWTGIGLGKFSFNSQGAWLISDFFGCNWSRLYTEALNKPPVGPEASFAYFEGVLKSLVNGCGAIFENENAKALDRLRRKIENASVEAIQTVGTSKADARHLDESIGPLMKRITDNGSGEKTTTAVAQKLAAATALNLPQLRNIQRQQDAMIQIVAARAAIRREAQVAILNDELLRQSYWGRYQQEVGAR